MSVTPKAKRFHQLLREARERAHQSTEVLGILLNMDEEDYIAIERGESYPDNETLKRLCVMLEWNYFDTQRTIINEISARPGTSMPGRDAALRALKSLPVDGDPPAASIPDTLGKRMRDVRTRTGQSADIIAMLLNIEPAYYARLEAGEAPGDDLLRRISIVYDWNYQDLQTLLRTEQARALQPRRAGSPYPAVSVATAQFQALLQDLDRLFRSIPEKEQHFIVAQLELIRETMRRNRNAS